MRVGAFLAPWGPLTPVGEVERYADTVEAAGFDSLWVGDHVVFPHAIASTYHYNPDERSPFDPAQPHLEPHTLVTYLAGRTSGVDLGISVFLVPLRNPVLAAKSFADLQTLSRGRLLLGVGVGWMEEEFEALGADFDARGAVTDEYIAIYRHIWSGEPTAFEGDHYSFPAVGALPRPEPQIPIIVGGNSEIAMRRAARLGDGWHPLRLDPVETTQALATLDRVLEEHGRDRRSFRIVLRNRLLDLDRTATGPTDDRALVEEMRDLLGRYAQVGVDELVLEFPYPGSPPDRQIAWLEWFGEHDLTDQVQPARAG